MLTRVNYKIHIHLQSMQYIIEGWGKGREIEKRASRTFMRGDIAYNKADSSLRRELHLRSPSFSTKPVIDAC